MKKFKGLKRFAFGTLAALMLASCISVSAFAADKKNDDQNDSESFTGGILSSGDKVVGSGLSGDDAVTFDPNDDDNKTGEASISVWGYADVKDTFSVDIEWGAMTFIYKAKETASGSEDGWKIYDTAQSGTAAVLSTYEDAINAITVTNQSSQPIYAAFGFSDSNADNKLKGSVGCFWGPNAVDSIGWTGMGTDSTSGAAAGAVTGKTWGYLKLEQGYYPYTAGTDDSDPEVNVNKQRTIHFIPSKISNTAMQLATTLNDVTWKQYGSIKVKFTTAKGPSSLAPTVDPAND